MKSLATLFTLLLVRQALGHIDSCAGGCELALSHLSFLDTASNLSYYEIQCGSQLRTKSVYSCMKVYCRPHEILAGRERLNEDCERYGNLPLPPFSIVDNISHADIATFRHVGPDEFDVGLELGKPAFPDRPLYDLAYRTKDAWNESVQTRHLYGNFMFFFWLAVIACGVVYRLPAWTTVAVDRFGEKGQTIPVQLRGHGRSLLQQHLTVPATFSRHCSEPVGWCTIPPRLQSILLLMFAVVNITLCCISYDVFEGNLYWTPSVQWTRYIGDRTGIIATANLPILWLFATRNSIVLYITGWNFDTAMQFHRWVARTSTVEAVIHSLAYTFCVILGESWSAYWAEWTLRYWIMGALATLTMCLLCASSVYPMRNYRYELFLFLHISLGLLTLLGMWYHIEIFNGHYNWYLWPCILLWLADRIARIARLAYINFPVRLSSLTYEAKSNCVWLSVPSAVKRIPKPGEYYFLYLLHDRMFYESHPFTMASWHITQGSVKPHLDFIIRPYDGFTRRLAELGRCHEKSSEQRSSTKVRMLIEGPYGPTHDLRKHDAIVLVVGGTGIAVALAYFTDLCNSLKNSKDRYTAQTFRIICAVQQYSLFEQVYEQQLKQRLEAIEERSSGQELHFELDIYITKADTSSLHAVPQHVAPGYATSTRTPSPEASDLQPTISTAEDDASEHSPLLTPSTSPPSTPSKSSPLNRTTTPQAHPMPPPNTTLTLQYLTRPNIAHLIHQATHPSSHSATLPSPAIASPPILPRASQRRQRTAIISCGPPTLADETRAAVVSALKTAEGIVDFWSEAYSW